MVWMKVKRCMMDIFGYALTTVIIFVVLAMLLMFIIKSILKVVAILIILVSVFLFVGGYLTYTDAQRLSEDIKTMPKLFLLDIDGYLVAGAEISSLSMVKIGTESSLSQVELQNLSVAYMKEDWDGMTNEKRQVFIYSKDAFTDLPNDIVIDNLMGRYVLSRDFAFGMIESRDPVGLYAIDYNLRRNLTGEEAAISTERIRTLYADSAEFKGMIFMALLNELFKGQHHVFLEYKRGTVQIYPETIALKLLKLFPSSIVEKLGVVV